MKTRPISVTVIGWLFIAAGSVGLLYHGTSLERDGTVDPELLLRLCLRAAAILGGAFLLRGSNWARWLLVSWLAYHVVLSAWHPLSELVLHAVLLAVIGVVLFCPPASTYFER